MGVKAELVSKRKELEAKRAKLAKIFEESKDGKDYDFMKSNDLTGKDMKARVDEVRKLNSEVEELAKDVENMAGSLEGVKLLNGDRAGNEPVENKTQEKKSIGELFTDSIAYKNYKGGEGPIAELKVGLKAVFSTSAGWAPESLRTGKVVEYATRPISMIDVVPPGATNQSSIVYMEETTFTNAAAETAEGGAYPEAALVLTEKSSPVRKIPVFVPVTDEQLEDVAGIQSYLENRLRFMLRQRLDGEILSGDGVAPNLTGILNVSGIQTYALTSEPVPDAIYKAITKVRVTGRSFPNLVVLHPNDWQGIRLLRTTDGVYIWGNPSEAGPERIWGLPVVQTDAMTENTGLVGDFQNHIQLYEKAGIEIKVSDSHSDYFVKGKLAVRAAFRVALPVYRPAAFCTVTGI